ncbi:MAG: DUF3857 domain-containing protein [bacterium]
MKPQYILFGILLSAASLGFAKVEVDPKIEELIKNSPGAEAYPQAGALVLLRDREVYVDQDGDVTTHGHLVLKILQVRAKDDYGDQSIRFNDATHEVMIERAYTRMANGTWIEPEKDAFTLTSAPEVQWASAYSQVKQRNVSFPGLEIGAAIELQWIVKPKKEEKREEYYGGEWIFGMTEPILSQTFILRLAPGKLVNYRLLNSDLQPEIMLDKAEAVYTWRFRDMPQIMNEPNRISTADLAPRLLWTSFNTWDELGKYIGSRFWGRVDTATTADAALAELVPQRPVNKDDLVRSLCIAAQRNIRNVNLNLGQAGYEPNTADKVWEHRYGETRDKAVLLCALLRHVGVTSFPIFVMGRNVEFVDLPALPQFHRILLAVPRDKDTLYVDPMAQDCRFGTIPFSQTYGQGCMLIGGQSRLVKVPRGDIESRTSITHIDAKLQADGTLEGTIRALPRGFFEQRCRAELKDMKEKELDIYFQRAASALSQGATVTRYELSDLKDLTVPAEVTLAFHAKNYANRQGDVILFDLFGNPFRWATHGFFPALPQVKYPIELPPQGKADMVLTMQLPEHMKVGYLPSPVLVDNAYYRIEMVPRTEGRQITWEISTEIKANRVSVEDYGVVREGFQYIGLEKNRLAILEMTK